MGNKDTIKSYFSSGANKAAWKKAKEAAASATGFAEYDDGKYEAQLVDIKVGRSEGSGRLQAVLSFKFTSGEYKGKTVNQYQGIEDQGIEYLLKTLKVLGYDDVDLDDLEDVVFKELKKKKPTVSLRLKTKEGSEYQNVYVIKVTEDNEVVESEEDDDDDDTESADKPEDDSEETEDDDDDDDEDGEKDTKEEDSEDDEDEEDEEEENEKPKKKAKAEVEDDDDDDDDDEDEKPKKKAKVEEEASDDVPEEKEKVELEKGMMIKIQHNKEVQKAKIVRIDEDNNKLKVKLSDGEKIWIEPKEVIDLAS